MRIPRIKPTDVAVYYHLYNRAAGSPEDRPFGPAEKEKFISILNRLQILFTVRVLAYQVMSNHYHIMVYAPHTPPSPQEAARRYEAYYKGERRLSSDDPGCLELAERMRDISWFMHALQQQFAAWYNHSRSRPRRGALWAQRFKNTLLGSEEAIWKCWKYIELNPVHAGMVKNPADYRFSSYGAWHGSGRHPFYANFVQYLLPLLRRRFPHQSMRSIYQRIRLEFEQDAAELKSETASGLADLDRKTRFWIDGRIIGTELFIRDMVARSNGILQNWRHPVADESIPHGMLVYNASRCT
jgi:REP element-mobilizing transposase RayT